MKDKLLQKKQGTKMSYLWQGVGPPGEKRKTGERT